MDFYTNVCRSRDKILVQGYSGNKKQKIAVSYHQNISFHLNEVKHHTNHLITGPLEVVELNSMGGARKFREKYQGVEGTFEIHGYDRYVYTYISDKFQGDIHYETSTK